jgi:methylmalonyl-CoA epimerase
MILRLDHVGIAVRSIDESLRFWELALGLELEGREAVPTEGVDVAFLPVGRSRLELLQATSTDSPVARFVDKRGPGIHHLTFEVDDIVTTLDRLAGVGIELLDRVPRTGAGGTRVAFVHPRATGGVLVELVERLRRAPASGGLDVGETVLAYLRDPHEKLWGVLRRLDPSGIVVEGIDLTSFDDWVAQVENGEESVVGPSVVFLPTPRIEKVLLDRSSGSLPSLSDRFVERTGRTVQQVLAG